MFVDPGTEVSVVLSWIRETAIIGGILVFGWRARGVFQTVKDFATSIQKHMQIMEAFALRMEMNHLRHIERYLFKLAKDRNLIAVVDPNLVAFDDVQPPEDVDPNAVQI